MLAHYSWPLKIQLYRLFDCQSALGDEQQTVPVAGAPSVSSSIISKNTIRLANSRIVLVALQRGCNSTTVKFVVGVSGLKCLKNPVEVDHVVGY
jgi:hypothetical protein